MSAPEQPADPARVVRTERDLGRVRLVEDFVPDGAGPFREGRFELVESREDLDLAIAHRAYEDIVISRSLTSRTETVSAVLRREQAELDAQGEGVALARPRSAAP